MTETWRAKCLKAARELLMGQYAAQPVPARRISPAMSLALQAAQLRRDSAHALPARYRPGTCIHGGCFAAGTLIRLADGHAVPIEELVPGTTNVCRQDGTSATMVAGAVGDHCCLLLRIVTELGSELRVTAYHPMVVHRNGLLTVVPARDLFLGEEVPVFNAETGQWSLQMVLAKLRTPNAGLVYNIELDGDESAESHFVVANGVMAGDLFLQRRLEQDFHVQRKVQRLEVRAGNAAA